MLTAILAVRNLFGERHDLWAINADDEYHEELVERDLEAVTDYAGAVRDVTSTQPAVPTQLPAASLTGGATRSPNAGG